MKTGNITRRGKRSFRIKIELDRGPDGRRRHHLETVSAVNRETVLAVKTRAKARLVELLHEINRGEHVARSNMTVREYMQHWLESPVGINPKTAERYRQLAEQQIYPHIGQIDLQKLSEDDLQTWHGVLLSRGGKNGRPLSPMTVRHAHRLLHTALARAFIGKKVLRNVASIARAPKVPVKEVAILQPDQVGELLDGIKGHWLHAPVVVALGTGLRRGEILALRWQDVDIDAGLLRVERSLGEAGDDLYFKAPKSQAGRRSLSLAPFVIQVLRQHRSEVLKQRIKLGMGKLPGAALVFSNIEGTPIRPDKLSRDWANIVRARKLPRVSFHALRHTNVSMLVDGGLDVYQVSRRIGHSSASLTLKTYTHLFRSKETEAAEAIEAALQK